MNRDRNLFSLDKKRLAKLLRSAAAAHIRRELSRTAEILAEATAYIEWANRSEWALGLAFVQQWQDAAGMEQRGEALPAAPAAWIHLSQELASLLDTDGDWIAYLGSRWTVGAERISHSRRGLYATLGILSFGLSALIIFFMASALVTGNGDWLLESPWQTTRENMLALLFVLGRVAGTALMAEHSFYWIKKAITGTSEKRAVAFLSASQGLALVK